MRLPFFGKLGKEKRAETDEEKRTRIRKRLGRIRKGEHLNRTKEHELEDLVGGLAKGDG